MVSQSLSFQKFSWGITDARTAVFLDPGIACSYAHPIASGRTSCPAVSLLAARLYARQVTGKPVGEWELDRVPHKFNMTVHIQHV